MTNEHNPETTVREVLQTVSTLTPVAPDLAERLIANASSGRTAVAPLRLARRFTIPLLAAAACIVVIVAVVVGGRFAADRSVDPPAVIQPKPTVAPPTGGQSSAATSAAHSTSESSTSNGSAQTEGQGASPVRQLPPATGAPDGFRVAAVNFMDSITGWALGDAHCATGTKPAARR